MTVRRKATGRATKTERKAMEQEVCSQADWLWGDQSYQVDCEWLDDQTYVMTAAGKTTTGVVSFYLYEITASRWRDNPNFAVREIWLNTHHLRFLLPRFVKSLGLVDAVGLLSEITKPKRR